MLCINPCLNLSLRSYLSFSPLLSLFLVSLISPSPSLPLSLPLSLQIGASDDLSRDKSTFMVEMSETAHILRTATSKSLVLIDEIGRGTSAAEGLALASAIARHLIQKNKSWVLFATHYHEIAQSPLLQNIPIQMARTEAEILPDGSVLIIPKVSPGIAKHSYALPVAALAGLPPIVIEDAHSILVQ